MPQHNLRAPTPTSHPFLLCTRRVSAVCEIVLQFLHLLVRNPLLHLYYQTQGERCLRQGFATPLNKTGLIGGDLEPIDRLPRRRWEEVGTAAEAAPRLVKAIKNNGMGRVLLGVRRPRMGTN